MDLNKLKTLLETVSFGQTPIQIQDVDWDFKSVTIITKAEGGNGPKPPPPPPDEDQPNIEVIDPPDDNDDGGDSDGGDDGDSDGENGGDSDNTSKEIKIGSIIQDFKTGQYGKVINIHPNGDVDWIPVSEEELRSGGFIASMRLNRSNLNGFIG